MRAIFPIVILGILTANAWAATDPETAFCVPKNPEAAKLLGVGHQLEGEGNIPAAIEVQKKILETEKDRECALTRMAGLYGMNGEFGQEIIFANKAVKANPKYMDAYINLGNGYSGLKRFKEARAAFLKALKLEPRNAIPHYSLGVLAEKQDDYKTALPYYKKSVELDPKFENGHFNLAMAYANLRQFEKARDSLKTLISLNPNAQDAVEMLRQVEKDIQKSAGGNLPPK